MSNPVDIVRADGVTVCRADGGGYRVERGQALLGIMWDKGPEEGPGRWVTWCHLSTAPEGSVGFYSDPADAVDAIVRTWPTYASVIAKELGVDVKDVYEAADELESEWAEKGPRAVIRSIGVRGVEITGPAAQEIRARLTASTPESESESEAE